MPDRRRILELHRAIQASPGYASTIRWKTLGRSFDVYLGHRDELRDLLLAAQQDPDVALRVASNVPGTGADELKGEFDRRLHNYVASVASLIDHSRRFVERHYAGSAFKVAYNDRRETISNDPLARFVRDLRSYVLHRELAPYKVTTTLAGGPPTARFEFVVSHLLTWDGWSAPARVFLRATADANGMVNILATIQAHAHMVNELWLWLFDQHEHVDAEVLAPYNIMMTEYRALNAAARERR